MHRLGPRNPSSIPATLLQAKDEISRFQSLFTHSWCLALWMGDLLPYAINTSGKPEHAHSIKNLDRFAASSFSTGPLTISICNYFTTATVVDLFPKVPWVSYRPETSGWLEMLKWHWNGGPHYWSFARFSLWCPRAYFSHIKLLANG